MRLGISQCARTHRSLSLGDFLIFDFLFFFALTQSTEQQVNAFGLCGRLGEKAKGEQKEMECLPRRSSMMFLNMTEIHLLWVSGADAEVWNVSIPCKEPQNFSTVS